jgi:hypothetical protein
VGDGLGAEDEHPIALGGDGKSQPYLAVYLDRVMGTDLVALPAADAGLILDLDQVGFFGRHRDGVGGTDTNTGQACNTKLGVNDKIQGLVRQREGIDCNLTAGYGTVKTPVAAKYVYSWG